MGCGESSRNCQNGTKRGTCNCRNSWTPGDNECCGFHGDAILALLVAAYFDESDDNKQAYGVGGFIGHQQDCLHLEWAWQRDVLDKYDLKYFKASELEYGLGEFRKLRDNPETPNALFSKREKTLFREIKTKTVDLFLNAEFLSVSRFSNSCGSPKPIRNSSSVV